MISSGGRFSPFLYVRGVFWGTERIKFCYDAEESNPRKWGEIADANFTLGLASLSLSLSLLYSVGSFVFLPPDGSFFLQFEQTIVSSSTDEYFNF